MMEAAVLEVSQLSHSFGSHRVIKEITVRMMGGEIYGLVGPDGVGKTTALRLICGAYKLQSGSVAIGGFTIDEQPEQARALIGYLSQRFSLYEDLTVLENIRFLAEVRGLKDQEWLIRARQNLVFVGLEMFEDRLAGQLSGGMKQKLSLACALVGQPKLLLLDEPTTGVDPITRQDFWQLIIRLAGEQGVAVLLCTPYMDEASRCSRVGFMMGGRIIREGSPGQLRQPLRGRMLELSAAPLALVRKIALQDTYVQDVQRFGTHLHLRVEAGRLKEVQERLPLSINRAGGMVERLVEISPLLEDVFIELAGYTGESFTENGAVREV